MDNHIDLIRAALATDATDEARARGAEACRALLVAFEPPEAAPTIGGPALAQIAESALTMLRNVPPNQLLELAITTLRSKLPAGTNLPAVRPLAFPMLPLPGKPR